MLRNMFRKRGTKIDTGTQTGVSGRGRTIYSGRFICKCNKCGQPIYVEDVKNNYCVCPNAAAISSCLLQDRNAYVINLEEWNKEMPFLQSLILPTMEEGEAAREKSLNEAIVIGKAKIRWKSHG